MVVAPLAEAVVKFISMHTKLQRTLAELNHPISTERKLLLQRIALDVSNRLKENPDLNLCFICTHNSRRSQIAQVWAEALAHHLELDLPSFSGGTEVTAFNTNAIEALREQGFEIEGEAEGNSTVLISFDHKQAPLECFSKTWDNSFNPQANRIALMTCSDAEENCPFIPGALKRFALKYEDPKQFDNTTQQQAAYAKCAQKIATELHYLFTRIKELS